jgi:hypothetical protein
MHFLFGCSCRKLLKDGKFDPTRESGRVAMDNVARPVALGAM